MAEETSIKNEVIVNEPINDQSVTGTDNQAKLTHVYKRRFWVLALFCAYSASNSFQWIEYSSITNIISSYYDASNAQVNLTSTIYMITYIPFIIHASLLLERVGLRKAIVIGTLGTSIGSLIKWILGGSSTLASFWWLMAGQTIVALSQLFIISIPPLLAAVWFPDNQVSTATGVGVFGNQLGIALGFIVPPNVIRPDSITVLRNDTSLKEVNQVLLDATGHDLNVLACAVFWVSACICLVAVLFLEDRPPKPPGLASLFAAISEANRQIKAKAQHEQEQLPLTQPIKDIPAQSTSEQQDLGAQVTKSRMKTSSILELAKDRNLLLLIASYGINVGVFYAISTVLNQMVEKNWPKLVDLSGIMGLLIVASGMVGSIVCGRLLDKTHAYKIVVVSIYGFTLFAMVLFTFVVEFNNNVWPLYITSLLLGFFMTGYLPLGFEYAAEITYPYPANTPAGLLNLSAQVFGLILTNSSSWMVDTLGNLWANAFLSVCLAVGLMQTYAINAELKRQKQVEMDNARLTMA